MQEAPAVEDYTAPFCPFVSSDSGDCIGGCPDMRHRACIDGETGRRFEPLGGLLPG